MKDPALPQAVALVAGIAWILCCYGCGVGLSCSSDSTPSLETYICHGYSHKKKKRKKKKKSQKSSGEVRSVQCKVPGVTQKKLLSLGKMEPLGSGFGEEGS